MKEAMMENKAAKIKVLFLDVDGVLTDGGITLNAQGEEIKTFDVKDGQGLRMLITSGVEVVIISGRRSPVMMHRASELGVERLHQAVGDKRGLCRGVLEELGLTKEHACSIGDDLPDLGMFGESGLCIAVADAAEEVREAADLITQCRGGRGAVREACEWILKSQGKWDEAVAVYLGK
jgi:3-deoxy-D-manno-octulosonate 8-phosphate phosphatase (KDO 8-P phosphatase)